MDLSELEPRLEAAIGLDAGTLGPTILRRAVERRLVAAGCPDPAAYLELVRRSPAELQALVEELVVHESWFLRQPQAFALLESTANAACVPGRVTPFRVLSIPCAGGEEPYSIALTLLEAGLPPTRFAIDAADISQPVIDRARAGVYSARAIRAVDANLRRRYFDHDGTQWTVRPILRASVRFLRANVLDLPGSGLSGTYDAVFCRNLLIYQSEAARRKIVAGLRDALAPGGLLFVGHAEMLSLLHADFERLPHRGAFALRRRSLPPPRSIPPRPEINATPRPTASARPAQPRPAAASGLARPRIPTPPLASPTVPERPVAETSVPHLPAAGREPQPPDPRITAALELANQRRFDEAIALCEQSLTQVGPRAATYHALGIIHSVAGHPGEARQAYERAVYLDPNHEDALLALALLTRRSGDSAAAARFENRARRAHHRKASP